jgi:hypothetical protein
MMDVHVYFTISSKIMCACISNAVLHQTCHVLLLGLCILTCCLSAVSDALIGHGRCPFVWFDSFNDLLMSCIRVRCITGHVWCPLSLQAVSGVPSSAPSDMLGVFFWRNSGGGGEIPHLFIANIKAHTLVSYMSVKLLQRGLTKRILKPMQGLHNDH